MEPENKSNHKCICTVCGADISREGKRYPYGAAGGAYCEECYMADYLERIRQIKDPNVKAKRLRRVGMRLTEISKETGLSGKELYEVIKGKSKK